jgi:AraC-like DNA-binding protein
MRVTYKTVKGWLDGPEPKKCSAGELRYLACALDTLLEDAENREKVARMVQRQVDELARKNGFESLEAMQREFNRGQQAAPGRDLAPPRRPYLIPDDPKTDAYAVYKDRMPAPIQDFLARNPTWTLEDLHYKRIAQARKSRGLPADEPYDPIAKHAELMATAQRNPRRKQQ